MPDSQKIKRLFLRQQGTLNPHAEAVRHDTFRDNEFFDPQDLVQVKYEMLRQVEVDKQPVSRTAKTFGLSRPSFYQAQAAFQQTGLAGLLPHKRGPRSGHKLTSELMQFVAQLQVLESGISSPQLAERITQRFGISVHPRSIDRHLRHQKTLR
ncbi:MAG: helix-turn-helix domain-containing protein [Bryobacteraceae bacterium]